MLGVPSQAFDRCKNKVHLIEVVYYLCYKFLWHVINLDIRSMKKIKLFLLFSSMPLIRNLLHVTVFPESRHLDDKRCWVFK